MYHSLLFDLLLHSKAKAKVAFCPKSIGFTTVFEFVEHDELVSIPSRVFPSI